MQKPLGDKAQAFHTLHAGPDVLLLGNCWDPGTARVLEAAGFKALGTTSGGIAFSHGLPDGGHLGLDPHVKAIRLIVDRVSVPVTADIENGYGPRPEDVATTVRAVIEAGVVGCNLEDATGNVEAPLFDLPLAVERIQAAKETGSQCDVDFFVNARTDVYLAGADPPADQFKEAVSRANAYLDAGADLVFVPPFSDHRTIERLVRELNGPLSVQGNPDTPPVTDLAALGVRRVSTATALSRAAFALLNQAAREILDQGSFSFAENAMPYADLQAVFRS